MNFQELLQRMSQLDQPVSEESLDTVEECGDMMPPMSSMSSMPSIPPKQQDNVNMNVNLSASGSGGIKDLMDILRNIDEKDDAVSMPIAIKSMGRSLEDDYANEPDEVYGNINSVTGTGDDLHSKGQEAPKVNGGGNPLALETLKQKLQAQYNQIKES
jgi:hypothetical protein